MLPFNCNFLYICKCISFKTLTNVNMVNDHLLIFEIGFFV